MTIEEYYVEIEKLTRLRANRGNFVERVSMVINKATEIFQLLDGDKVVYPPLKELHDFQQSLLKLKLIVSDHPLLPTLQNILNLTNELKSSALKCIRSEIDRNLELSIGKTDIVERKKFHTIALGLCERIPQSDLQIRDMQILGTLYCFKARRDLDDNLAIAIKDYTTAQEFFKAIISKSKTEFPAAIYHPLAEDLEQLLDQVDASQNKNIRANAKYLLEKYLIVFPNDFNYSRRLLKLLNFRPVQFQPSLSKEETIQQTPRMT